MHKFGGLIFIFTNCHKKAPCTLKNKKGFTLVELMMVIAIIAVLALVLIPKMRVVKDNAEEAGQETAVRVAQAMVSRYNDNYPAATGANHDTGVRWYNPPSHASVMNTYKTLASRVELMLQQVNNPPDGHTGADKTKTSGMQNPYSHSLTVLHHGNALTTLPSDLINPAFMITGTDAYNYANISKSTPGFQNVLGTVIIYIRNDSPDVEIFYITEDGNKSQKTTVQ